MVAPNRELANTLFPTSSNTLTTPITYYNNSMDIEVDTLRERLAISSINIFRGISAHSSVSFILYVKRIEVQNNNLS